MKDYKKYYNTYYSHLEKDYKDVLQALNNNECVCLSSAPQMGDIRFMDYLVYKLSEQDTFNVIYDQNGTINDNDIMESDKTTLFILPHFQKIETSVKNRIESELKINPEKYLSIIIVPYPEIKSANTTFSLTGKWLSYIKIRKPLDEEETRLVIDSRRKLNNWKIPQKLEAEVYRLSGGIYGLIKYISGYVDKNGNSDDRDMLEYPPIMRSLKILEETISELKNSDLKQLGLLNEKEEFVSELLDDYLHRNDKSAEENLSPMLRSLLNLFIKNKGKILSLDKIEDELKNDGDYSYWGNYKAISRLRKAITEDYRILNVKGRGYRLEER